MLFASSWMEDEVILESNQESNPMATQPSEQQRNSNHAEQLADVSLSVISDPSQSTGAPEISEEEVDGHRYRPLLQATLKGDWEFATRFFEQDPASKMAKITSRSETVLHIAALSAQDKFFENLVELLSPHREALEMVDCDGRAALHIAVLCGRLRMVKALVRSHPRLTQLDDKEGRVPLEISAWEAYMHKDIAWFLAKNTTDDESHPFSGPYAFFLIYSLTVAGHHDITLYLVGRYPRLITLKDSRILDKLAIVKSNFLSGTRLGIMEALIYKCLPVDLSYKTTDENSDPAFQRLTRSLWNVAKFVGAISRGIPELVKLWIEFFPELIWLPDYGGSLRTFAVVHRQESILRLFLKGNSTNELSFIPAPTPKESKQFMRAVAEYSPNLGGVNKVSGAAFEMQRELQWFRAMDMCIIPDLRTAIDEKGKKFWEIFMENHKELLDNGEKWVKEMANSCMLVSTLIATVLFTAAFTVPGGNDNNTGIPLLLGKDSLLVFAISDTLGLFSSVTAIMLFLAILSSQYEWEDFLRSLPKKIIMGLSFLFLSLVFMLVAFAATLTIVLDKRLQWVFIPITLLASLTVFSFLRLQLPLLFRMVKSTYGPSIFCPVGI